MQNLSTRSQKVKEIALQLGFSNCGISKATKLEEEEPRLEKWLNANYHGSMHWMENHFDKRLDPSKLVPNSKSVVSLLYNYYPYEELKSDKYKVSKYAYNTDYHFVIKDKLKHLLQQLKVVFGDIEGRVFVDSAPVMERAWAAKSGLGWIGKHSLLLSKGRGSFSFICELIIDLELESDGPVTDHCGSCTACIDACPTDAIVADKIVDSNKCISYLTIELKDQIPNSYKGKMEGWIFGCDICQDVCPWNRFAVPHNEEQFKINPRLKELEDRDWKELTEQTFKEIFKKSAIKRAGYIKLRNSIDYCTE